MLPDGAGVQYSTSITVSGFPGVFITSPNDLEMVCLAIEHSYLGDIEIKLECPYGVQVSLLNSGGPLGTSGGGTFLGDPIDDDGNPNAGECWDYCFSSTNNTWGDYPTEFGLGNTVPAPTYGNNGPSLNPGGVYLPEDDFSNFIGCPVDGDWSILVTDHLVSDNGFICGWGFEVSALLLLGLSDNVSQDVDQNTIEVYPNPATQMLNLHSKSGEISTIDLYDIRGKILLSFEGAGADQQLDISDLDNGVYILSIKTKVGYSSVRVIKE